MSEEQEQEMKEEKAAAVGRRRGPAPTIWGSFSKQMDDLMKEMG